MMTRSSLSSLLWNHEVNSLSDHAQNWALGCSGTVAFDGSSGAGSATTISAIIPTYRFCVITTKTWCR
jgi:hypothetical protein